MSVWQDGLKIYQQGDVRLDSEAQGKHFRVQSQSDKHDFYYVDVDRWNTLTCGCHFGVTHGVNGGICKHKIAVILWLINKSADSQV